MDLRKRLSGLVDPELRANLAVLIARRLRNLGMFSEARQTLEAELSAAPNHPMLLRSLGLETFRIGEVSKGISQYDKGRWKLPSFDKFRRPFKAPFWNGQPLKGKRLLVWAEQGIGDQIMQARILDTLIGMGAIITLEADIRLKPLLKHRSRIRHIQQFVEPTDELLYANFDYQTSMLSAWRFVEEPLQHAQCLEADQTQIHKNKQHWARMGEALNVGISWFSKAKANGVDRSLASDQLRPLSMVKNVRFHSLQYGDYDVVGVTKGLGAPILVDASVDPLKDLTAQAAQIAALDLVITIDNATAHIAGALGIPCWVITPKASEWRWGTVMAPLPLYQSVRLFRATETKNWDTALWQLFNEFETWTSQEIRLAS